MSVSWLESSITSKKDLAVQNLREQQCGKELAASIFIADLHSGNETDHFSTMQLCWAEQ